VYISHSTNALLQAFVPGHAGVYGGYSPAYAAAHAAHLGAVAPGTREAYEAQAFAHAGGHYPTWANVYDRPAAEAAPAAEAKKAAAAPAPRTKGKGTVSCPRNNNFASMAGGYLFPEIGRKKKAFAAANPTAKLVSLGVGDTTHPVPKSVAKAMSDFALVTHVSGFHSHCRTVALLSRLSPNRR